MQSLDEAVVEWLQGERLGQNRFDMISEIDRLAKNCKLWPAATFEEWHEAVERTIQNGLVVESGGKLKIAPQTPKEEKTDTQMELF